MSERNTPGGYWDALDSAKAERARIREWAETEALRVAEAQKTCKTVEDSYLHDGIVTGLLMVIKFLKEPDAK